MRRSAASSLGGIASVASGVLLAVRAVVDRSIGAPPSSAGALLGWRDAHAVALAWSNELAVFAAVLLLPLVPALYRWLDGRRRPWVGFGCGLLATSVPVALVVALFEGRLAYPVYGIALDASGTALVVSLAVGGAHLLALLLAAAIAMLGLALRPVGVGRWVVALSLLVAVAQVAASYPWLIGLDAVLGCQLLAGGWFVLLGLLLLSASRLSQPGAHGAGGGEHLLEARGGQPGDARAGVGGG